MSGEANNQRTRSSILIRQGLPVVAQFTRRPNARSLRAQTARPPGSQLRAEAQASGLSSLLVRVTRHTRIAPLHRSWCVARSSPVTVRRWLFAGGLFLSPLFLARDGWAEVAEVTVRAQVDRAEVTIGEPIQYTITTQAPRGVQVTPPTVDPTLDECTLDGGAPTPRHTEQGLVTTPQRYTLRCYTTGPHTIPAPRATYQGIEGRSHEAYGQPLTITVKSLLPASWKTQDIHDVKPPIATLPPWWVWIAGGVALLGGAARWWWLRQKRHAAQTLNTPPRPPHDVAMEALISLQRERLLEQGRYEAYYVTLSGIVRQYVEARFGVRAPEMTTEEFLQAALRRDALSSDHRHLLRQFLLQCDLVKFARYQPSQVEGEEAWTAAQRFVQQTCE